MNNLGKRAEKHLIHAIVGRRTAVCLHTVTRMVMRGGRAACAGLRPMQQGHPTPYTVMPPCAYFFWLSWGFVQPLFCLVMHP